MVPAPGLQLTIKQIDYLRNFLTFENKGYADGQHLKRVFSNEAFSAVRHFFKTTEDLVDRYIASYKKTQEGYEISLKEEKGEWEIKVATAKAEYEKLANSTDSSEVALTTALMEVKKLNVTNPIEVSLNTDEKLLKLLTKDVHGVEATDKTLEVIRTILQESVFTADDSLAASIYDIFFPGA